MLRTEKAELLFHPSKAILALRSVAGESSFDHINGLCVTKTIHLSDFIPIALESAELKFGYRYHMYGTKRTKRTKSDESIILFDLREAEILSPEKDICILPDKYRGRYGIGFYENIAACGLHKIDIEGLWKALYESKPTGYLAGQIIELTEFCQKSLAEFELSEKTNIK